MPETWGSFAIVRPGPAAKTGAFNSILRRGQGVVVHSAEGSLEAALGVLDGPRPASWHLTVAKDGRYYQHYPLESITWHAGADANPRYVGIECEGVAGEPLTPEQLATLRSVLDWLEAVDAWPVRERGVTLFEHNEFMPTSCPSGRIPWEQLVGSQPPPAPDPLAVIVTLAAVIMDLAGGGNLTDTLDAEDRANLRWLIAQLE